MLGSTAEYTSSVTCIEECPSRSWTTLGWGRRPAGVPRFSVSARRFGGSEVIVLTGALDMATAPHLVAVLDRMLAVPDQIVVDIGRLTFIDSSWLRLLLRASQLVEGRIRLRGCSDQIPKLFDVSGLSGAFALEAASNLKAHVGCRVVVRPATCPASEFASRGPSPQKAGLHGPHREPSTPWFRRSRSGRAEIPNDEYRAIDRASAELGKLLLKESPLETILAAIGRLAVAAIPFCEEAGVTLDEGGRVIARTTTGGASDIVDSYQYQITEGPCIEAARARTPVLVEDMKRDVRWPRFTAFASSKGIRSSYSIPMSDDQDVIGVLNLYSVDDSFGPPAEVIGALFAEQAATAVRHAAASVKPEN